jgi:hypothetical protein
VNAEDRPQRVVGTESRIERAVEHDRLVATELLAHWERRPG